MSEVVVVADNEGVEGVFGIETMVPVNRRRIPRFFDGLCFERFRLCEVRDEWLIGRDLKLYLKWLPRSVHQHVLNQAEIIVFEPDLTEVVRHLQSQKITFQNAGSN